MQRTLAAHLASQSNLEVVSFQHFDCLLFERGETWKMFLPRSKRLLGGTTQERLVIGDLLAIFEKDLQRLRPPSTRFKFVDFATSIPIANFPSITASSVIIEGVVDPDFFRKIRFLLNGMPDGISEWTATFGEDFLTRSPINRCVDTVKYLRSQR